MTALALVTGPARTAAVADDLDIEIKITIGPSGTSAPARPRPPAPASRPPAPTPATSPTPTPTPTVGPTPLDAAFPGLTTPPPDPSTGPAPGGDLGELAGGSAVPPPRRPAPERPTAEKVALAALNVVAVALAVGGLVGVPLYRRRVAGHNSTHMNI